MKGFPNGANEKDPLAFSAIADEYRPLTEGLVSQFAASLCADGAESVDREDLRQEALIALYSAWNTFDFEQEHVSFGLYAKICIRNRLITLTRRRRDGFLSVEQGEESVPETDGPEQMLLDREQYLSLIRMIDETLTDIEKRVLVQYLNDKTYAQIASALGLTEKAVDNAIYRLKAKLKKRI